MQSVQKIILLEKRVERLSELFKTSDIIINCSGLGAATLGIETVLPTYLPIFIPTYIPFYLPTYLSNYTRLPITCLGGDTNLYPVSGHVIRAKVFTFDSQIEDLCKKQAQQDYCTATVLGYKYLYSILFKYITYQKLGPA